MLESCDNRARREKRNGEMFRRHAAWPKVAAAVIEAPANTPKLEVYINRDDNDATLFTWQTKQNIEEVVL
jgi:hypothetical protein